MESKIDFLVVVGIIFLVLLSLSILINIVEYIQSSNKKEDKRKIGFNDNSNENFNKDNFN